MQILELKQMNFLIIGTSGVGKSTLINYLEKKLQKKGQEKDVQH